MRNADPGEYSLMYNQDGTVHPIALTEEQHEALQVLIQTLGNIHIHQGIEITYKN